MAALSFHDYERHLVGLRRRLLRHCRESWASVRYVESDRDSLFAGLDAGPLRFVCNGVEVTEERAKTYDFTTPYGYIHTARRSQGDNDDIKSSRTLPARPRPTASSPLLRSWLESYSERQQASTR